MVNLIRLHSIEILSIVITGRMLRENPGPKKVEVQTPECFMTMEPAGAPSLNSAGLSYFLRLAMPEEEGGIFKPIRSISSIQIPSVS